MAVKAKKRRLSIAARRDHEGKNQQTKVEAELERQEEEMLAVARLLKQVDKAEAVTVAKQILTATTIASKMDEDAQSSGMNGSSMMVLNGSATKANGAADRTRSKSAHSRNGVQERETVAMVTPPSDREIRTVDLEYNAIRSSSTVSHPNTVNADANSRISTDQRSLSPEEHKGELPAEDLSEIDFDIPIDALTKPSLAKAIIQQKARSTYAPAEADMLLPTGKRRPGRPRGYFLGPTSCAACRDQHRKCDYNTICLRCVKAKIPCDRSGTVERPSVIVREARQQAKAEAAAVLAAAVAAGLAPPIDKPKPPQRIPQLHTLTLEAELIGARLSTPTPPPTSETSNTSGTSAAAKRKRTPSPSDVTRENIIERRVKRVATNKPREKYDPSVYMNSKNHTYVLKRSSGKDTDASSSASSQRGRSMTWGDDDSDDGSEKSGNDISTTSTSAGSPSRSIITRRAASMDSKLGETSNGGRTGPRSLTAVSSDSALMIKRGPGRPSNAMKFAMNPSLVSPVKIEKIKRKPGRPPKTSSSTLKSCSTVNVPLKRTRASLASITATKAKNSKGKQTVADTTDDEDSGSAEEDSTKEPVRLVRKAYLKSGLYSSDLKVNPPNNLKQSVTLKSGPKSSQALVLRMKRGFKGSSSSNSGPFFQLPINYGAALMSTQKDFCLPFDIMQAWQAGLLRKSMQPEPFIKIRSNIFLERKRRIETSPMVCHCTPPPPGAGRVGCGEDCYNRVMFYECISAHCPCGDQCSNQRFQKKHKEDHLRVIWTKERGFGIQTIEPIKKGTLVIEYRGEVISQSECHRRMETIYKNNKNFYFLEYEKGEVVDACQKGTNARFVNHSCSPNSQIEKWFLNGEMSIGIFASQDIPAGVEISYDYNFSSFRGAQKQKCRCGAPNCRGYIGERVSKSKESGNSPSPQSSARSGKKTDARKRKAGRRKVNDQEPSSLRRVQMPSVRQIRERQSDKYKEGKMAAIRYTKLFLFRNIRLVESKYIKYARTKSRSYHETVSRSWLMQARQCRKRSLEGVVEDLRTAAQEKEDAELRGRFEDDRAGSSVAGDDEGSDSLLSAAAEGSIVVELDAEDVDSMVDSLDEHEDEEGGSYVSVEEEVNDDDDDDDDDDEGDGSNTDEVEVAEADEVEEDELEGDSD